MKRKFVQSGFTIVELLVAIGLLGMIIASSGLVFSKAVESHRLAKATSEITQKLHAITDQIEKDFASLRKDGEIFIAWVPKACDDDGDGTIDRYERLDRMLFFTSGDFVSYDEYSGTYNQSCVTGNLALVCYSFARDADNTLPPVQQAADRTFTRTQHIFTADSGLADMPIIPLATGIADERIFRNNFFLYEYTTLTMDRWMRIPVDQKTRMLTLITAIQNIGSAPVSLPVEEYGSAVDPDDPTSIYMFLCEGLGSFSVQGWSDTAKRWVPMYDPDGDGDYTDDSDFRLSGSDIDTGNIIGMVYPYRVIGSDPIGTVVFGGTSEFFTYPDDEVTEEHFNDIPGFGRALKFTFTLYDSMGVFKDGKTFTHIVYLDK